MPLSLPILVLGAALATGPALAANPPAYIVINPNGGSVLAHNEADQPWYPASLSKLMTAYVTFKALREGRLRRSSPVRISSHAHAQPPSRMGFAAGTVLSVDNALKMMLVTSANDIAVAIAETVGGSERAFVAMMNDEAGRLGMSSTHFENPHGLPASGQVSTARDLAVLARAVWVDFPAYRKYFGIPAIRLGKVVMESGNALLERYQGANGMKTGYICASGFNLIASATREGRTLIAVVLGARTSDERGEVAAGLLDEGFAKPFGAGPQLTGFAATRASAPAVDMHDFGVCSNSPQQGDEDVITFGPRSTLGPRFFVMDPVAVYTGKADPPPSPARSPAGVPMPRLRPTEAP